MSGFVCLVCGCGCAHAEWWKEGGGMKFREGGFRRVPLFQSCDGFCRPMNAGIVHGSKGEDWDSREGKESTDAERYYFYGVDWTVI